MPRHRCGSRKNILSWSVVLSSSQPARGGGELLLDRLRDAVVSAPGAAKKVWWARLSMPSSCSFRDVGVDGSCDSLSRLESAVSAGKAATRGVGVPLRVLPLGSSASVADEGWTGPPDRPAESR